MKYGFVICSQDENLRTNTGSWIHKHIKGGAQIVYMSDEDSIFEAYNKGIDRLGDVEYVCFCHEDIDVENINLKAIEKKLNKPATGFVGAAGAKKLDESGVWWTGYTGKMHPNLSGKAGHQKIDNGELRRWYNNYGPIGQVEVLDGVILFCRRDLLDEFRFNDVHFDGWDFYDISITWLANHKGYKNYTMGIKEIEFYHWGLGNVRDTWNENRVKFLKWKKSFNINK